MKIVQALHSASLQFQGKSDTPSLDAQTLLAFILGKNRSWILTYPEVELNSEQLTTFHKMISRLDSGLPLPYLLGKWEFFGLEFKLTPLVLIPRPETEILVERGLNWLDSNPGKRWAIDVGSGSGCIAIALAYHIANLRLIASDISLPVLFIARENAFKYRVTDRIDFLLSDLFPPIMQPFDLVCANLPYIPSDTLKKLPIYGREPGLALDGGVDGLKHISRLLQQAPHFLARGGLLLCEIESRQADQVVSLAQSLFTAANINIHPDLAGLDRVLSIQT